MKEITEKIKPKRAPKKLTKQEKAKMVDSSPTAGKKKHVASKMDKTYHTRGLSKVVDPSQNDKETSYLVRLKLWAYDDSFKDVATHVPIPDSLYGTESRTWILTKSVREFLEWSEIEAAFISAYNWREHLVPQREDWAKFFIENIMMA